MTFQEKAALMVEETIDLLRNKPVESTLIERWYLLDEAWDQVRDLPQPLQFGKGLGYVLERASLPIKSHDLFLGRFIDRVLTEEEEAQFQEFWKDDHPEQNPIFKFNGSHITLHWQHLLDHGLVGYLPQVEKRMAEERCGDNNQQVLDFLEGMRLGYIACIRYIERYGEAARQAEMEDLAVICEHLTAGAPTTMREAMQLMLFVLIIDYVYNGTFNTTLSYGRLDHLLLPFYESDIAAGRLTREEAGALIDDFNCRASLFLGRGEHQMSGLSPDGNTTGYCRNNVFDAPTYILIGGYSNTGDHTANPLTRLFIEHIHPRLENPVYIYRWTRQDDPEIWRMLCNKLRQNCSILIYNDETMIPAFENAGISHEEAVDYTLNACNWPNVPRFALIGFLGDPLPKMIMDSLLKDGKLRSDYPTLDDLYQAIGDDFRALIRRRFRDYRNVYRGEQLPPPSSYLSITDCFYDGPIERARTHREGGAKYPAFYTRLRSIATATDMMAALDEVVYTNKQCTLKEMVEALEDNFENAIALRTLCLKAPKYGTDNDLADRHAQRLMNMLLDIIDEESINEQGERDVISFNVTYTDMAHIHEGTELCATPDGRTCGAPLSENLSPTTGYIDSVTALLNSVSKLPFERMHGGAFNLRLRSDLVRDDEGLARLCAIIETYLENGGMQLQLSVANTAELRRAQEHPEDYKDLMVRITGYSAVFVDMCRSAQEEFIRRDEMGA